MEFNEVYKTIKEQTPSPHDLAKKYEAQIKEAVAKKFSLLPEDLTLLLGDREGVYLSQEEKDTLCSFVVGEKNGHLYLVAAKIEDEGKTLDKFKCDVVS